MKHFILLIILGLSMQVSGQFSQQARDSINRLSYQDHRLMMEMLGIDELRHGPSGNPNDANYANTDESKASPYTSIPNPLLFDDGQPVKNAAEWEKRKLEIFEHFDREMYGRMPENTPSVSWEVVSEMDTLEGKTPVRLRRLKGIVDNSSYPSISVEIDLTVGTPLNSNDAVPVVMEFGWNFPSGFFGNRNSDKPSWKEMMLQNNWGFAILIPTSYQADNGAGLRQGIIGLVNKGEPRKLDDWGTLRAWAWGASRAIDFFVNDPFVDEKRVAIEGLSRYGKAALVAMAYEPRIAIGFIGSSGAGGAKLLRRVYGEQVENLASSAEYHWFTPNFIKYAGPLTPNDLPIDAHQLIALCAPRPVFISVGSENVEGHWIDAKGMFVSAIEAGPVYKLLGRKDMGTTIMPEEKTFVSDGEIAFRQHEGGHTVEPNWPYFIEFAKRYFE